MPDYWLDNGNPWEIERLDISYSVKFYGYVRKIHENGKEKCFWEAGTVHKNKYLYKCNNISLNKRAS